MSLDYHRLALLAFGGCVAVALVVAASTSTAAFGAYNSAWDGTSDLRTEADAAGATPDTVRNVTAYEEADPNGTVALVFSPDSPYSDREIDRVRQFLRGGGTLVVAEDVGPHGNALLAGVGASARFDGRLVRDERRNYRSSAMPVATDVSNRSLVADSDALTLNHGTVLEANNSTVLVNTSEYGYLDDNRNGALDDAESMDPYPVAAVETVGEGRVIAVSDPSLFINSMLDRDGNRAFVRALVADHRTVLVDHSHTADVPPLTVAVLVLRDAPLLQVLIGGGLVAAIAAWGSWPALRPTLRRRFARDSGRRRSTVDSPGAVSQEALSDYVASRHPDWDRERIERLVENARAGTTDDGDGP